MKQKCQLQTGKAHCKNAATPLRTRDIHTTNMHFQNEVCNFVLAQGAQKLLAIKV